MDNIITRVLSGVLALFVLPFLAAADQDGLHSGRQKAQITGERMYRDGVLPSGKAMTGYVKDDIPVTGTAFACNSCHLRSGLGSLEGTVLTTPTNGAALYQARSPFTGLRAGGMGMAGVKTQPSLLLPQRPAYTEETLAYAIRGGVDPAGRVLNQVMPRYNLAENDMATLVSYLKNLSAEQSPGVDSEKVYFATIVTDDISPEILHTYFSLLDDFIAKSNGKAARDSPQIKNIRIKRQLALAGKTLSRKLVLDRWVLKGPPEGWRSQLEGYYRKRPVFALLGGLSGSVWQPVHDFCEINMIPCLFPQVDTPVISDKDWYTLYFSKGYYQEGEAAARFLHRSEDFTEQSKALLIFRESRQGKMLADGFLETWRNSGNSIPEVISLREHEVLTASRLQSVVKSIRPNAIIVWDDQAIVPILNEALPADLLPSLKIIVSAGYLEKSILGLHETLRKNCFITYPESVPSEEVLKEKHFFGDAAESLKGSDSLKKVVKRTYSLVRLLSQLLPELKENLYRDYLLDLVGMTRDVDAPLYERLSFGPGQRYAAKGCFIVQLGPGKSPEIIKKSDWLVY